MSFQLFSDEFSQIFDDYKPHRRPAINRGGVTITKEARLPSGRLLIAEGETETQADQHFHELIADKAAERFEEMSHGK